MTKRVALARALALDPEIVFLDEPTSGLDPISAGEFDVLIRTLQQTLGLTVFMVTHDLDSLHTVCDRIAALADGKVVADGPMPAMLASEHPWVKVLFPRPPSRAALHLRSSRKAERMETRARYALIGLFVLAAIGAVFGFVYWLNNTGGLGERTVYRVRFENTVSGLLKGAAVLFNGIRVGEVTELALEPDQSARGDGVDRGDGGNAGARRHQGRARIPGPDRRAGDLAPRRQSDGAAARLIADRARVLVADPAAGQSMTEAARQALRKIDTLVSDNSEALHSAIANLNTFTGALARNSDRVDVILNGLEQMTGGKAAKEQPVPYDIKAPTTFPPPTKAATSSSS